MPENAQKRATFRQKWPNSCKLQYLVEFIMPHALMELWDGRHPTYPWNHPQKIAPLVTSQLKIGIDIEC